MVNKYHDVIHDYGPGASDERWEKVQTQLVKFDPSRFTFGGARGKFVKPGSETRRKPLDGVFKSKSYSILETVSPRQLQEYPLLRNSSIKKITIGNKRGILTSKKSYISDDLLHDMLLSFVEAVNTKICFNTFYSIIYGRKTFECIFDWHESATTLKKHNGSRLKELYTQISYYIRLMLMNRGEGVDLITQHFNDLSPNPDNLFNNLDNYILIGIYDTAEYIQPTTRFTVKKGGSRAVDQQLRIDELSELITELSAERDRLLSSIESIYDMFTTSPNDYSVIRSMALNATKNILRKVEYKQMNKAGSVDNSSSCINKCCFLPPIPRSSRQANKTLEEFVKECFLDYYNVGLIGYYTGILNGLKVEEESARLRAEREQIRAESGQLTRDQRLIRDQFCSLIAKLGLVLNGEYSKDGTQIQINNVQGVDDSMTAKDVNLLANWANWEWDPMYYVNRISPTGARSNIDVDLFDYTDRHFKDFQIKSDNLPICRGAPTLKYVIDNAAMVPNNLKDYVFCPVSSVVDGMKKCNVSQLEEYGIMDFLICEKEQYNSYINSAGTIPRRQHPYTEEISPPITDTITHYYNGRSIYNHDTGLTEYIIELLTPFLNNPIKLHKNISLAGTALEAHNVLRETLVNIINFIVSLNDTNPTVSTCLFQNKNGIFGGLYDCLFNTEYSDIELNSELPNIRHVFLLVILNILFKGAGDFFQEINAACKWGGYSDQYVCSEGVIPYNSDNNKSDNNGNTLRMFIANDQPSGCRFAFLLLNGYSNFINEYAFGGYMGTGKTLLVTRADISGQFRDLICSPKLSFRNSSGISHGGRKQTSKYRIRKRHGFTPLRIESAQSNVAFSLKNPPIMGGLNEKRCKETRRNRN